MQLEREVEIFSNRIMIDRESFQNGCLDSGRTTRHHIDISYYGLGFFEYILSNDIIYLSTCGDPVIGYTRYIPCNGSEIPSCIPFEVRFYPLHEVLIKQSISICHNHYVTRDMRKSFHLSFTFIASIFFEMNRYEYIVLYSIVGEYSMRIVSAAIVHDDDLIKRSCLSKC